MKTDNVTTAARRIAREHNSRLAAGFAGNGFLLFGADGTGGAWYSANSRPVLEREIKFTMRRRRVTAADVQAFLDALADSVTMPPHIADRKREDKYDIERRKLMKSYNRMGLDSQSKWSIDQYMIDAGWSRECMEATAAEGVADEDAEGLTAEQCQQLLERCVERLEEHAE